MNYGTINYRDQMRGTRLKKKAAMDRAAGKGEPAPAPAPAAQPPTGVQTQTINGRTFYGTSNNGRTSWSVRG